MSASRPFEAFAGHKYLNLETYRRNGTGARTPVWFAEAPSNASEAAAGTLYVYTLAVTGKVKRIRNNPRVRIAPCNIRGVLLGDWVDARAVILLGEEAATGMRLLNKKYKPWKQLLDFVALFRPRERVVFAIRLE